MKSTQATAKLFGIQENFFCFFSFPFYVLARERCPVGGSKRNKILCGLLLGDLGTRKGQIMIVNSSRQVYREEQGLCLSKLIFYKFTEVYVCVSKRVTPSSSCSIIKMRAFIRS